jgi:hypothetical protein
VFIFTRNVKYFGSKKQFVQVQRSKNPCKSRALTGWGGGGGVSQIVPTFDDFSYKIALALSETVVATQAVFPSAFARIFFRLIPNHFLPLLKG